MFIKQTETLLVVKRSNQLPPIASHEPQNRGVASSLSVVRVLVQVQHDSLHSSARRTADGHGRQLHGAGHAHGLLVHSLHDDPLHPPLEKKDLLCQKKLLHHELTNGSPRWRKKGVLFDFYRALAEGFDGFCVQATGGGVAIIQNDSGVHGVHHT